MIPSGIPGIFLEPNVMGGFQVFRSGMRIGWIHDNGGTWRAYQPTGGVTGKLLGAGEKLVMIRLLDTASPQDSEGSADPPPPAGD